MNSNCIPGRFYITWINGKCYRLQYLHDYTFLLYHKKEPMCEMVFNTLVCTFQVQKHERKKIWSLEHSRFYVGSLATKPSWQNLRFRTSLIMGCRAKPYLPASPGNNGCRTTPYLHRIGCPL